MLIVVKKKKKNFLKSCDVLPLGGLFLLLMGLNSSLSSPTSEQVCKKGGGLEVDPGLEETFMSSPKSLVT